MQFRVQLGPSTRTKITGATSKERKIRSRSGCAGCRRQRVKCDETFPVCLRCQRQGTFCETTPRPRQWQVETPQISLAKGRRRMATIPVRVDSDVEGDEVGDEAEDGKLLRYWLEKASQIMVIDPDINPLSFPILEHLQRSPSLLHAVQSIAAAHQQFFHPSKLGKCLEERNWALSLVREELGSLTEDVCPTFLTVMMLGISESWIGNPVAAEAASQHLHGGRAIIDMVLAQDVKPPSTPFMLGAYLYWDMTCAFLIPSHDQVPLNTPDIFTAVVDFGQEYHPIGGYCVEIFYLLGTLGRYCRSVVDTGVRGLELERTLDREFRSWEPNYESREFGVIGDAYRHHGLINLAALCYRSRGVGVSKRHHVFSGEPCPATDDIDTSQEVVAQSPWEGGRECMSVVEDAPDADNITSGEDITGDDTLNSDAPESQSTTGWRPHELESSIRERALLVTRMLTDIPSTHPSINFQAIPLLTGGSELTAEDHVERELVRRRFRELYSLNHLRVNLLTIELLEELWVLRDGGEPVTWLDLMLRKGWFLMLS